MSEQELVATQLITQEELTQLAAAMGVEVPMAELLAGGVTQKTLSYQVDTFQRQKLVDHFSNPVRDLARLNSSCLCPKQENSLTLFQMSMLVHSYEVMSESECPLHQHLSPRHLLLRLPPRNVHRRPPYKAIL